MKRFAPVLAAILVGCASSGVIPIDRGAFLITKDLAAPGVTGTRVLADLYVEANAHCAKTSQVVETIDKSSVDPIPFVRAGSAKLEFRCISPA